MHEFVHTHVAEQWRSGKSHRNSIASSLQYTISNANGVHWQWKATLGVLLWQIKGKQNGREKHISRFPDSATTSLLFVYLLFAKSKRQVVTSALHLEPEDCTADRLATSVGAFSRNGVIVNAQELRNKVSTSPGKVGINLLTLQYRHYHVEVMKNFLTQSTFQNQKSRSSEWSLADMIDVLKQQTGNSAATAQ